MNAFIIRINESKKRKQEKAVMYNRKKRKSEKFKY